MNRFLRTLCILAGGALCAAGAPAQTTAHYLIVNDNHGNTDFPTFATFFKIGPDGNFTSHMKVVTGGLGGGYGAPSVAAIHSKTQDCFFVSETGSDDVVAIDANFNVVGHFRGPLEFGTNVLAVSGNFLLVSDYGEIGFVESGVSSFRIQSGCQLQYLGSVSAVGTEGGAAASMATHGKMVVVAYGDGSIESFHISNGFVKSNGDLQNTTASRQAFFANSVDISKDGRFAIFGDRQGGPDWPGVVEVANISSGKLSQPTKVYNFGPNFPSGYVRLSPDGSLLYISGDFGGSQVSKHKSVAIAFFGQTNGVVAAGCSSYLKDPGVEWWSTGNVAFADNAAGSGSTLYVAENSFSQVGGTDQYVATVNVKSDGKTCSFSESKKSNFELQNNSFDFGTVATFPPRAF